MAKPTTWVVDITHYLDARGNVPPDLPPVCRYMGEIVAAASPLAQGDVHVLPLSCRRRPGHRPCPGRVHARLDSRNDTIIWHCSHCEARGLISNWHASPWDRRLARESQTAPSDEFLGFTPSARRAWMRIPAQMRIQILNTVWCSSCQGGTSMAIDDASVCRPHLVFRGRCTRCGGTVARIVEEVGNV